MSGRHGYVQAGTCQRETAALARRLAIQGRSESSLSDRSMTRCEEIRVRMIFYLDDELERKECAVIKAHLDSCEACRAIFQSERRFLEMIRGFRPLRVASPELRARVEKLVNDPSKAPVAPPELRQRIQRSLLQLTASTSGILNARHVIALAAIVGIALSIGFWYLSKRNNAV